MKQSYTTHDWHDVKEHVKNVNAELYDIIDEISPDLPIKLAKYPYGVKISDVNSYYIPTKDGFKGYDAADYPYFLSLDKKLESYIEYDNHISFGQIYSPGTLFPVSQEMSKYPRFNARPSSIFSLMSGLRNINMMPLHQDNDSYYQLVERHNIDSKLSPKNIKDHQKILSAIIKEKSSDWHCSLLIFDGKWRKNTETNPKWHRLYQYILEQSIKVNFAKRSIFHLNNMLYDITKKRRLKIKPFTIEAIKQLLLIAIGDIPGYRPAIDESGLPVELITNTFNEEYSPLNTPVIIEPHTYNPTEPGAPLYHSLCANDFNINEIKSIRPLQYLSEIANYLTIFFEEFKAHPYARGSIYGKLGDLMACRYYSALGGTEGIADVESLLTDDPRFDDIYDKHQKNSYHGLSKRSIFAKSLVSFTFDANSLYN